MMKFLLPSLLLAAVATVSAQTTPTYDLTLYNSGFVLVKETRMLDLRAGAQSVRLGELPRGVLPNTLITRFGGSLGRVTQHLPDRSLGALLRASTGKLVHVEAGDGRRLSGLVEAVQGNRLYLKLTDGTLATVPDYTTVTVTFTEWPAGYFADPALDVELRATRAGRQAVTFFYQATGLGWQAEYDFVLDEAANRMAVTGSAVLRNQSGFDFRNASIRLLAGDIGYRGGRQPSAPNMMMRYEAASVADDAMAKTGAEALGDVYVYALPGTTDLTDASVIRVPLVDAPAALPTKRYRHFAGTAVVPALTGSLVQVFYDIPNTAAAGLGKVLPAGEANLYLAAEGRLTLIGKDRIGHTAVDGTLRVNTGRAFDVLVKDEQPRQESVRDGVMDQHYRSTVRNNTRAAITVEVAFALQPNQQVVRGGADLKREGGIGYVNVVLQPGQERNVEVSVRTTW